MLLKGKTAVITGCSRGIGYDILHTFVANESNIIACSRKQNLQDEEHYKELEKRFNVSIKPVYFDFRNLEQIKDAAKELVFADKFSYSVIDLSGIEKEDHFKKLVSNYYKDSFTFDQMACSSSRAIFWVGSKELLVDKIEKFWELLKDEVLSRDKTIEDSVKMNKINNIYLLAMTQNNIKITGSYNNIINRVEISNPELFREYNKGGGLFFEYFINDLDDIASIITKKDQTLGIFGFSEQKVVDFILKNKLNGINRVVSIGKALDFSPIWDSYNLLYEFAREIELDI